MTAGYRPFLFEESVMTVGRFLKESKHFSSVAGHNTQPVSKYQLIYVKEDKEWQ